jgi:tRNA(Ile)-lysidine synthase
MFSNGMDQLSLKLVPFEQAVLRFLQHHKLVGGEVLVAVSGGVDSMSLLFCLWRLRGAARLNVNAVYIHHGKTPKSQLKYRDRAKVLCKQFCEKRNIPFFTNTEMPPKTLRSENELREFRLAEIAKIKTQNNLMKNILFLAHHQDDLVETQLLRLLRGTGLQGLKGFSAFAGGVARPFVGEFRKKDIQKYAKKMKINSVSDPSNRESQPLRNWLRQKWLTPLERRQAGLYSSLSRSLQQLGEASSAANPALSVICDGRIDHAAFMTLTRDQKEALLASYMRQQNIQGYAASHIREVLKRLDSARTEHNFRLLRRQWYVNAEHIFCEAPP